MPSKRSTETIRSITRKKGKYVVATDAWTLSLSLDAFSETPLYVGKVIGSAEYFRLKHLADLDEPLRYAHGLLARRPYSVHLLKEKVLAKFPECDDLKEIVFILKKEGLLDDARYAEDYAASKEAALYGPNRILDALRYEKGIAPEVLEGLKFERQDKQVERLMPSLERRYASLPYRAKRQKIEKAIVDRGYDREVARRFAEQIAEDPKAVRKRLAADCAKAKASYSRKYEGYELRQRIIRSLLGKGYKMDMIEEVLPQ